MSGRLFPYLPSGISTSTVQDPNPDLAALPTFKGQTDEVGVNKRHDLSARTSTPEELMIHAVLVPFSQIQEEERLRLHPNEHYKRSSDIENMAKRPSQNHEPERQATKRIKMLWCGVVIILLLVMVGAAVSGVCAGGYCSKPEPPTPTTSSPELKVTPSPSTAPIVATREVRIANLINDFTLTGREIRYPPPQNPTTEEKALAWLITEDPARMAATQTNRLIQRYVLIVLWYSQVIPHAGDFTDSWRTSADECDWEGILSCQGDVIDSIQVTSNNTDEGQIPNDIGLLTALTRLVLNTNALIGSIPSTIGLLTNLNILSLEQNKLSGSIPSEVSALTKLTRLSLHENKSLIGTIPDISLLTLLQSLSLYENGLVGSIPSFINGLTSLTYLGLHDNLLNGTIPDLRSLRQLSILSLGPNRIEGTIPSSIGLMTSLTGLFLDELSLNGSIPSQLSNLSRLHHLSLYKSGLTGTIPDLSKLSDLEQILLYRNSLRGAIPRGLSSMTDLINCEVNGNSLTGTIPNLGSLASLETLWLSENLLDGPLPASLGNLTSLSVLNIYDNNFMSTIPSTWGGLISLTSLNLHRNFVTGTIPTVLQAWTSVVSLDLSVNGLTGTLSSELQALTALTYLALDGNSITGKLPTELQALTALEYIYLFNTGLNGTLPFCNHTEPPFLDVVVDCNELDCPCCTHCCPTAGWENIPGWKAAIPDQMCES